MKDIETGNVARYCRPGNLEDGIPRPSAFEKRTGEKFLSCYWLEFFEKESEKANVIEVKKFMAKSYNLKETGSFAVLNIKQSKKILEEASLEISYREKGLPHCGIFYDANDLLIAKLTAESLAKSVQNNYPIKDLAELASQTISQTEKTGDSQNPH